MNCSKRSFAVAFVLLASLLSLNTGTLDASDADRSSLTLAAARTAKERCVNTCRARYRDCRSLKQLPSSECQGIYYDCTRYTCNAVKGRRTRLSGGNAITFAGWQDDPLIGSQVRVQVSRASCPAL
jgi:hypothetical protein